MIGFKVGLAVGLGVGDSVAVGARTGVGVSAGIGVTVGSGVGVGTGVGVAVGRTVSVGAAVGVGCKRERVALIRGVFVGRDAAKAASTAASTVAPMSGVGAGMGVAAKLTVGCSAVHPGKKPKTSSDARANKVFITGLYFVHYRHETSLYSVATTTAALKSGGGSGFAHLFQVTDAG